VNKPDLEENILKYLSKGAQNGGLYVRYSNYLHRNHQILLQNLHHDAGLQRLDNNTFGVSSTIVVLLRAAVVQHHGEDFGKIIY